LNVFIPHDFNFFAAEQELKVFADLLNGSRDLKERDHILKLFRKSPNLCVLMGTYASINNVDMLKHEFRIGEFLRADLAVTRGENRSFCLIEFEGAFEGCIFDRTKRILPTWGEAFEKGFSQIVDWSWAFQNRNSDPTFRDIFKSETPRCMGVVVVGRSSELRDQTDRARWDWRSENVNVGGWRTTLQTYDELFQHLDSQIKIRRRDAELLLKQI
jgi:hypothetical protein